MSTTDTLKLNYPADVQEYVSQQLASGRFDSESTLATAAIQVIREIEAAEQKFREDLRRSIEQADRGEIEPLDTEQTLAEARRRLGDAE